MADFAALALRLIRKHGRPIVLRNDAKERDDTKPWRLADEQPEPVLVGTFGFFMDTTAQDLLARVTAVSRLVLSPITETTTVALVPGGVTPAPSISAQVVDGSRTWEVKQVGVIEQGAVPAVYVLELGN